MYSFCKFHFFGSYKLEQKVPVEFNFHVEKRCKALHQKSTKIDHEYSKLNYFNGTKPNIPYTKTTAPLTRCRCFFFT